MVEFIGDRIFWLFASHPGAVLFGSIMGGIICAVILALFFDSFFGKPTLSLAVVVPFMAFFVGGSLFSVTHGKVYHIVESKLVEKAPQHPALEELNTIQEQRDWVALLDFQKRWKGEIRYGADLLVLKSVANDIHGPLRDNILDRVRYGAISSSDYQRYVQKLLAREPVQDHSLAARLAQTSD